VLPLACTHSLSIVGKSSLEGSCSGFAYRVATISRLLKIVCRISPLLQGSFAKEIYNFKERTNCSHPIVAIA